MDDTKLEYELHLISYEIRVFAEDAYDYIWKNTVFHNNIISKQISEDYFKRNPIDMKGIPYDNFIHRVAQAALVSQFLLRDYFRVILSFSIADKNIFKKEVKLMWSHWLEMRNNIFVKVIDTLAMVAEAFLFFDCYFTQTLEVTEMKEWFIEWFEEKLAPDFIRSGGWKVFDQTVEKKYKWFEMVDDYVSKMCHVDHFEDVWDVYDCNFIIFLRHSPVKFPIPERVICDECRHLDDRKHLQRTVYVRLENEYVRIEFPTNMGKSETCVDSPNEIEREVKREVRDNGDLKKNLPNIKNEQIFKDFLSESNDLQNDNDCKDFSTQVGIKNASYKSRTTASNLTDDSVVTKLDFKYSMDKTTNEDLCSSEFKKCTISESSTKTPDSFSVKEISKTQRLLREKNVGDSTTVSENEIDAHPKINIAIIDYSKKQANLFDPSENHCYITAKEMNILSESSSNLQRNCIQGSPPSNEISCITDCQTKSLKIEVPNMVSVANVTLPETFIPKYDPSDKELSPEKPTSDSSVCEKHLQSIMELRDLFNTEHSPEGSEYSDLEGITAFPFLLYESVINSHLKDEVTYDDVFELDFKEHKYHKLTHYDVFIYELEKNVINQDYEITGDQNHIYFVSENYSNSFRNLFKAHFNDEDKSDNNTNKSEKLISNLHSFKSNITSTVKNQEFIKTFDEDFKHFKFITGECRYYYFDEEAAISDFKPKKKQRRKPKKKSLIFKTI